MQASSISTYSLIFILILRHYGIEVIRKLVPSLSYEILPIVFQKLYEEFIEAIDAIDNGIEQYSSEILPKFRQNTHLT